MLTTHAFAPASRPRRVAVRRRHQRCRLACAVLAVLPFVLAPPCWAATGETPPAAGEIGDAVDRGTEALRLEALTVLAEALASPTSVTSRDLLSAIVTRTGLGADSVRAGLQAQLDRLDAHRAARDSTWMVLSILGGDKADDRDADRLFREFIGWGRKGTAGGSHPLGLVVERAAAKAKVPAWVARDVLVHAVATGLSASNAGIARLPAKLGLRVAGRSSYAVDAGRFPGLLRTEDDQLHQTRLRGLHTQITDILTRRVTQLPRVRWAIVRDDPTWPRTRSCASMSRSSPHRWATPMSRSSPKSRSASAGSWRPRTAGASARDRWT